MITECNSKTYNSKVHDDIELQYNALTKEDKDDWQEYMSKIHVQKMLKDLNTLPEYDYPTEQSSIFLLSDGKMVGSDIIFSQSKILEKIIGIGLNTQTFSCNLWHYI